MKKILLVLTLCFAAPSLATAATLPPMTYEQARKVLVDTFGEDGYRTIMLVTGSDPITAAQYTLENAPFTSLEDFLCLYSGICLPQ